MLRTPKPITRKSLPSKPLVTAGKWSAKETQTILRLARRVRKWVVRDSSRDGGPFSSRGYCVDASERLKRIMQNEEGLPATLRTGYFQGDGEYWDASGDHAWLEFKGRIIDVTADQFQASTPVRLPAIVIGQRFKKHYYHSRTRGRIYAV